VFKFLPSSPSDTSAKRKLGEQLIQEADSEDDRRVAALNALTQLARAANDLKSLFS
jgi:hypothetical protein